ncbi:hypothetical protein ACFX2I_043923 [Malus domestica]
MRPACDVPSVHTHLGSTSRNAHVDTLTGLGSTLNHQLKRSFPVEYLEKSSIDKEPVVEVVQINITLSWYNPIIDYIVNGTLPADRLESKKL